MPIENVDLYNELISRYHENPDSFAFFVGAGLSRPLFPSWASLLLEMINKADKTGLQFNKDELIELVNKGEQYLDIAEACVTAMGETAYRNLMEQTFDKDFTVDDIPSTYIALLELSNKTIITTNYDRIPDIGGKGEYRIGTNKNIAETNRAIVKGNKVVLKIHGDINDQSSIVLTSSEYQKIIHNNPASKTLLTTLLNSKTFIFIGFSLSDPHINLILDNLKAINDGMPISHYAIISEKSKFKLSAFQKKYGLNMIGYTTIDGTHSELTELLRALNTNISSKPIQHDIRPEEINNNSDLVNHISNQLESVTGHTSYFVWVDKQCLNIGINSVGETRSEMQREILSVFQLFNFESTLFNKISVYLSKETPPHIQFNLASPIILNAECDKNIAKDFSAKKLVSNVFWEKITFNAVPNVSDPFDELTPVEFPLNLGILGS